ncbi:MAG: cell surface protein [Bacillota bacterium]|nr:cell surface protein [Bacillota bacterium]
MKSKILLVCMGIALSLAGCGNKEIEISEVMGCYTINVHSYEALAGNADYVMIGKVVDELGVDYKWPVMKENEDGTQTELTKPYTKYSVEVIENLKGELSQEEPITITKKGGITKDGKFCDLYESDTLPVEGNEYVFYIYAQEDGRNLVSGPNSSIPLSDNGIELSTISEEARLDRESILEKVRNGVANQIETDREKRTSKDDVSVK